MNDYLFPVFFFGGFFTFAIAVNIILSMHYGKKQREILTLISEQPHNIIDAKSVLFAVGSSMSEKAHYNDAKMIFYKNNIAFLPQYDVSFLRFTIYNRPYIIHLQNQNTVVSLGKIRLKIENQHGSYSYKFEIKISKNRNEIEDILKQYCISFEYK